MGITNEQVEPILKGLKAAGMQAMEVFYKDYSPRDDRAACTSCAIKYDLLPLGGSDYHGIFGNDERLPGRHPAARLVGRALAGDGPGVAEQGARSVTCRRAASCRR